MHDQHTWLRAAVALALVLAGGGLSHATAGPQGPAWTWDARVGIKQDLHRNSIQGQRVSSFDERDVAVTGGVDGFIVHPALARFRVSGEGQFSAFSTARASDSRRWGLRGELRLFPVGRYRATLFANRQQYDYADLAAADPLTVRYTPDQLLSYGGRLFIRSGLLRGVNAGYERSSIDFLDRSAGGEDGDRAHFDWARAGQLTRHLRVERDIRDFGPAGFRRASLTGLFDQHGQLTSRLRWQLSSFAARREVDYVDAGRLQTDTARVSNQFSYRGSANTTLSVSHNLGYSRASGRSGLLRNDLSGRYQLRPHPELSVTPFAAFGWQTSDDSGTLQLPQAGVAAHWSPALPSLNVSISGSGAYARSRRTGPNPRQSSTLGFDLAGSLSHGDSLRKQVDLTWSSNRFQTDEDFVDEFPGLDPTNLDGSFEDRYRARFTLQHRWRTVQHSAYAQWERNDPSTPTLGRGASQRLTGSYQLSTRRLSLSSQIGASWVDRGDRQQVRYASAAASYRPHRLVRLRGSYRRDFREVALAPDIDGDRVEVGATTNLGLLILQGRYYLLRERQKDVISRTNQRIHLSLSRRFGGILPFFRLPGPLAGVK